MAKTQWVMQLLIFLADPSRWQIPQRHGIRFVKSPGFSMFSMSSQRGIELCRSMEESTPMWETMLRTQAGCGWYQWSKKYEIYDPFTDFSKISSQAWLNSRGVGRYSGFPPLSSCPGLSLLWFGSWLPWSMVIWTRSTWRTILTTLSVLTMSWTLPLRSSSV